MITFIPTKQNMLSSWWIPWMPEVQRSYPSTGKWQPGDATSYQWKGMQHGMLACNTLDGFSSQWCCVLDVSSVDLLLTGATINPAEQSDVRQSFIGAVADIAQRNACWIALLRSLCILRSCLNHDKHLPRMPALVSTLPPHAVATRAPLHSSYYVERPAVLLDHRALTAPT